MKINVGQKWKLGTFFDNEFWKFEGHIVEIKEVLEKDVRFAVTATVLDGTSDLPNSVFDGDSERFMREHTFVE